MNAFLDPKKMLDSTIVSNSLAIFIRNCAQRHQNRVAIHTELYAYVSVPYVCAIRFGHAMQQKNKLNIKTIAKRNAIF